MTMTPEQEFEDALTGNPDIPTGPPLDLDQVTQWVAEVSRIRRVRQEYQDAYSAAVARLNQRLVSFTTALDEQEEQFVEALEMYHAIALKADPKAISIKTPAGTLKSTATQPSWVYDDEAVFTAWAAEHLPGVLSDPKPAPPVVVVKNKVKAALKDTAEAALKVAGTSDAVLTHDGAVVPGLRVLPAGRNYSVVTD